MIISMYKFEIIVEYKNRNAWKTKRETAKEVQEYIKTIHQAINDVKSYTVNIIPDNYYTKGNGLK